MLGFDETSSAWSNIYDLERPMKENKFAQDLALPATYPQSQTAPHS